MNAHEFGEPISLFVGTLLDPLAAMILIYILIFEGSFFSRLAGFRLAIVLAICGLIGQTSSGWITLIAGKDIHVMQLPWSMGKDLGYFVFAICYLRYHLWASHPD